MKTFTVTLHHLGFYRPSEQEYYGKTTIVLAAPEEAIGEAIAEIAFDETNNPNKKPNIQKMEGKCYTLSVGDVAEIKEKKEFYLCMGSGWMKISRSETSYLAAKMEQAHEEGGYYSAGYEGACDLARRRARGFEQG